MIAAPSWGGDTKKQSKMSVPKNKRQESRVEFEKLFLTVADHIDDFIEHDFYADLSVIQGHINFINMRRGSLARLSDDLLYNIRIANSIYPTNFSELNERRLYMDKAIGVCYTILTQYQRIFRRLGVREDKYVNVIEVLDHMINSLKSWRKSDNKFKEAFKNKR